MRLACTCTATESTKLLDVAKNDDEYVEVEVEHQSVGPGQVGIAGLPETFYWLACIHTVYLVVFHALVNYLPHYMFSECGYSETNAGYISSIPYAVVS